MICSEVRYMESVIGNRNPVDGGQTTVSGRFLDQRAAVRQSRRPGQIPALGPSFTDGAV
jgi:hypothetical protein